MNTPLIPVVPAVIGNQTIQTVDGRALHTFLEVQTEFRAWIVRRIEEYGFEEDKDFRSFLIETSKDSSGGRPSKEYALTLDMAKELAMVERNEKGRQARRYFIECERRLLQQSGPAFPEMTFQQQTEPRLDRLEQIVDSLMASLNPALPRPAPVIPDWQRILKTVLREIETGKYLFPHAFRDIDSVPCVILRTAQVMAHLRTTPRLRSFFDGLELKSDRVLKRTLRQAGLIVRLRFTASIAGQPLHHAVAIHIAGVRQGATQALNRPATH